MPHSVASSGNGRSSHSSSSASRRAATRQYRTVAHTSQVDESLFGAKNSDKTRQNMLDQRWKNDGVGGQGEITIEHLARERKAAKNSANRSPPKESVQVITKDLIRNLIVPDEDPSGQSIILRHYDFQRIKNAAHVLTDQEKNKIIQDYKKHKEKVQDDVQDRKNYLKIKDLERRKNEKLNDLEEEEKIKAEHLRQKANEQLQEQEDEIKHLNELILNAKCHAIRDAQIMERDHIKNEMEQEEMRLDQIMERDRIDGITLEEQIEQQRKQERLIGCNKLLEQIQENEQERLLELERKDQENRMMQKYLEKLCEEEAIKLEKKRSEQTKLREELNKCNNDILQQKELIKEQDRALDQKVLEYQRSKAEREAAFEAEQEASRLEKEREVARLRSLQERSQDEQAERDLLRAKRAHEQAERDWRRKEAEEAKKKAIIEDMLKKARTEQMQHKEHTLAVQAARDRAEFERVLNAQKELSEKDQRELEMRKHKNSNYASEVRHQIREKEQIKVSERNSYFEEGKRLDEEARHRRQKLEEVKKKKLQALSDAGLPAKYVTDVARRVNVPISINTSS